MDVITTVRKPIPDNLRTLDPAMCLLLRVPATPPDVSCRRAADTDDRTR